MRCLGIDYGERRIGLSFGDELGIATPLPAVTQDAEAKRIEALVDIAQKRRATDLVVGYPYNMDGTVGFKAKEVDAFIAKLTTVLPLSVHRIDERLTTVEAIQTFGGGRDDALRRSGKIDSVAAALILQDFLDQRIPPMELGNGVEDSQ